MYASEGRSEFYPSPGLPRARCALDDEWRDSAPVRGSLSRGKYNRLWGSGPDATTHCRRRDDDMQVMEGADFDGCGSLARGRDGIGLFVEGPETPRDVVREGGGVVQAAGVEPDPA